MLWGDRRQKRAWVERNTRVFVFNGTEPWSEGYGPPRPGINKFEIRYDKMKASNKTSICSHFLYHNTEDIPYVGHFRTSASNGSAFYILFRPSVDLIEEHNVGAWKAYLEEQNKLGHPVRLFTQMYPSVIEELPTPTTCYPPPSTRLTSSLQI